MNKPEVTRSGPGAEFEYACAAALPLKNTEETICITCEETEHKGALATTLCRERT